MKAFETWVGNSCKLIRPLPHSNYSSISKYKSNTHYISLIPHTLLGVGLTRLATVRHGLTGRMEKQKEEVETKVERQDKGEKR